MQKGILLFDIDRTIFDTDGMIKNLEEALLAILGYPNTESFKKIEKDYIKTLTNDRINPNFETIHNLLDLIL